MFPIVSGGAGEGSGGDVKLVFRRLGELPVAMLRLLVPRASAANPVAVFWPFPPGLEKAPAVPPYPPACPRSKAAGIGACPGRGVHAVVAAGISAGYQLQCCY